MGKLYTISPFIKTESLPRYASIESVISDNFYFFNIYSFNPYIVREYMDFIDINFDFAFSKLKLDIVIYDYPDELKRDESEVIEYINTFYDLYDTPHELNRAYGINRELVHDLMTGKETYVYFNDYATYDSQLAMNDIFNDIENDSLFILNELLNYILDNTIVADIRMMILQLGEYEYIIDEVSNHGIDFYDNDCICNGMYILCQLKGFIQYELNERRKHDGLVRY